MGNPELMEYQEVQETRETEVSQDKWVLRAVWEPLDWWLQDLFVLIHFLDKRESVDRKVSLAYQALLELREKLVLLEDPVKMVDLDPKVTPDLLVDLDCRDLPVRRAREDLMDSEDFRAPTDPPERLAFQDPPDPRETTDRTGFPASGDPMERRAAPVCQGDPERRASGVLTVPPEPPVGLAVRARCTPPGRFWSGTPRAPSPPAARQEPPNCGMATPFFISKATRTPTTRTWAWRGRACSASARCPSSSAT